MRKKDIRIDDKYNGGAIADTPYFDFPDNLLIKPVQL